MTDSISHQPTLRRHSVSESDTHPTNDLSLQGELNPNQMFLVWDLLLNLKEDLNSRRFILNLGLLELWKGLKK